MTLSRLRIVQKNRNYHEAVAAPYCAPCLKLDSTSYPSDSLSSHKRRRDTSDHGQATHLVRSEKFVTQPSGCLPFIYHTLSLIHSISYPLIFLTRSRSGLLSRSCLPPKCLLADSTELGTASNLDSPRKRRQFPHPTIFEAYLGRLGRHGSKWCSRTSQEAPYWRDD